LHKLLTALLLGLFFAAGTGVQNSAAQTANFCFTNNSSFIIYMRAFSPSRGVVWPANGHWVLDDRVERCALLACVPGEQVCYGGTNNSGSYWGIGYDGSQSCESCCGTCDNRRYHTNLVD
jgi:hypothetical protein